MAITLRGRNIEPVLLGKFPASERYFDGSNDFPRPFGKRTSVAVGSERVYVGTGEFSDGGDGFEIATYSFQDGWLRTVRGTATRERITARHRRSLIDERVRRWSQAEQKRRVRALLEGLEYPEVFPAHHLLLTDPADNLWVQSYPLPGRDVQTWRVYSPNGTRIGTVRTPPGFRLLEAGNDYLLGVRTNDWDIALIEAYRLMRS